MIPRWLLLTLPLAACLLPGVAIAQTAAPRDGAAGVSHAATVTLVEGEVAVVSTDMKRRRVSVGDSLIEGESIVTGGDGELHLEMDDGGFLSVRPNTRMRIVKFRAKGESGDSSVLGLLQGSFRAITGWIGKYNSASYTIKTPTATIGVRGTDHEPLVIPAGSKQGDPGTYDKVNEGTSYIATSSGRTEVGANQSGFVAHGKAARPRLLDRIPVFYRPGRHDHLFAGRHAKVQAALEKRRDERRTLIRQKLERAKPAAEHRRANRQQAMREKREAAQKARDETKAQREDELRNHSRPGQKPERSL